MRRNFLHRATPCFRSGGRGPPARSPPRRTYSARSPRPSLPAKGAGRRLSFGGLTRVAETMPRRRRGSRGSAHRRRRTSISGSPPWLRRARPCGHRRSDIAEAQIEFGMQFAKTQIKCGTQFAEVQIEEFAGDDSIADRFGECGRDVLGLLRRQSRRLQPLGQRKRVEGDRAHPVKTHGRRAVNGDGVSLDALRRRPPRCGAAPPNDLPATRVARRPQPARWRDSADVDRRTRAVSRSLGSELRWAPAPP